MGRGTKLCPFSLWIIAYRNLTKSFLFTNVLRVPLETTVAEAALQTGLFLVLRHNILDF